MMSEVRTSRSSSPAVGRCYDQKGPGHRLHSRHGLKGHQNQHDLPSTGAMTLSIVRRGAALSCSAEHSINPCTVDASQSRPKRLEIRSNCLHQHLSLSRRTGSNVTTFYEKRCPSVCFCYCASMLNHTVLYIFIQACSTRLLSHLRMCNPPNIWHIV